MSRLPKLVDFFNACLSERGASLALAAIQVATWYTPATLSRLIGSSKPQVRMSAAWGLGLIGQESHLESLGHLLRDEMRGVRSAADEARRGILFRTQSPWQRRTVEEIEDLLASSDLDKASCLADQLVEETELRSDAYFVRAWVRFCNIQWESAIEDCKKTLMIDPFCYRACAALGQCYWHQNRNAAARECFYESVRLYPDFEPAHVALRIMHGSSSLA
ncbi:MAG: HEAT repeat domain-containing protein [Planctomycetota bacterium]|jgi:tetratricopeptide (TPR) repeat protein